MMINGFIYFLNYKIILTIYRSKTMMIQQLKINVKFIHLNNILFIFFYVHDIKTQIFHKRIILSV